MVKVKIYNRSDNPDPTFSTSGSSGFDIRANEDGVIIPGRINSISTGLHFIIPEGYELQLRSRSGLGSRGIALSNGIGTIDSDYRGEIRIPLINQSFEPFHYKKGDRLCQGIIQVVPTVELESITEEELNNNKTERSHGGFGSTGIS